MHTCPNEWYRSLGERTGIILQYVLAGRLQGLSSYRHVRLLRPWTLSLNKGFHQATEKGVLTFVGVVALSILLHAHFKDFEI